MKYKEITDYSFFLDKDHYVYDYSETDSLDIFIKSREHSCACPQCGEESRHLHATYMRKIQDIPIRCKPTCLHINVYKYECDNPECGTKVFTEPLSFARTSQVRTDALNTLILGMAMFMSNEGASSVLKLLGVTVSNDTIQRLYNRIKFEDDPDVEAVGIDDVATRKGQTYATAVYDLKDHRMIALLDGRDGTTLKEWLKEHKKIKVVARDRASSYAKAVSEVLPECVQVADRFHLLQNLMEHLKDIFKNELPPEIFIRGGQVLDTPPKKISREKKADESVIQQLNYDNTPPTDAYGNPVDYDDSANNYNSAEKKTAGRKQEKKQKMIQEIQSQWNEMPEKDIALICSKYKISRPAARRYIQMPAEEIQGMDRPRKSKHSAGRRGNAYVNIIYKMMRDGHADDTIYFYLRHAGIKDPSTTIWFYLSCISQNNFPGRKKIHSMKMLEDCYPDDVTVIKRDEILKYILTKNPKSKRNKTVEEHINLIKEHYPAVRWTEDVFQIFHSALMEKEPSKIDDFLEKYTDSSLKGFCECIKKDIAPVKNAISLEVSSGFVEGNNNKSKLIKRIVYGRAKLVNLSKKCFLAFMPKMKGFELSKLI